MPETLPSLWAQAIPLFDRMNPSDIIPVLAVTLGIGGGVLIALTAIIIGAWRRVRDRKLIASLIQDMLDRNMTAAEIEQVMSTMQAVSEAEVRSMDRRAIPPRSGKPAKTA